MVRGIGDGDIEGGDDRWGIGKRVLAVKPRRLFLHLYGPAQDDAQSQPRGHRNRPVSGEDIEGRARVLGPHRDRLLAAQVAQQGLNLVLELRLELQRIALAQGLAHRRRKAHRGAQPDIDPARVQRLQEVDLFRDKKRRVVEQHDACGAHANALRARRYVRGQHARLARWDARHPVVLGQEKPTKPQPLHMLRMLGYPIESARRPAVQNRKAHGHHCNHAPISNADY